MRLATFTHDGRTRIGLLEGAEIIDLSGERNVPADMIGLLGAGAAGMQAARAAASRSKTRFPVAAVRIEAPVPNPRKFLGLGASYRSRLAEAGEDSTPAPKFQIWFNKQVTCVNGPYDPVHMPRVSQALDYEGELAIIIGRRCRHVSGPAVRDVIAGFTVCNDLSVRDWQMRSPTATLGKSFDTHGPLGPCLVTLDELPGIHNLSLRTWVNGELRQDGNTSELIYRFRDMVEELSTVFTLEPGDILTTGTPAGIGAAKEPPRYLRVGDVCRVEIEGIGYIENRVIPEP